MAKKGYRCYVWEKQHDDYLVKNYLLNNNHELGVGLGVLNKQENLCGGDTTARTADAVRKRLNHLSLRRPKKSQLPKQTKPKDVAFFNAIKTGLTRRKQKEVIAQKTEKQINKMQKERMWAQNYIGETKPIKQEKPMREMVWITLDNKTRMEVPRGDEDKWRKIYAEKQQL